jgi:type III pantothenate kinase
MILCIDIGNTSIKLARVDGHGVIAAHVISSRAHQDELARAVARAAKGGIDAVAIASVVPKTAARVRRAVERELGMEPFVLTPRARLPIKIATRRPGRVGADRICAACGAVRGRARHAIIVDAGSAITVDLVLDRVFKGGLIMAGPRIMLSSLRTFTAQLPALEFAPGRGRIDDTVPAMLTGAEVGSAGAILKAVQFLDEKAGRIRPTVWLTGGHIPLLSPYLPETWKRIPGLTLAGLADIARLNHVVK